MAIPKISVSFSIQVSNAHYLEELDRLAAERHTTRSALLENLLVQFVSGQESKALDPDARRDLTCMNCEKTFLGRRDEPYCSSCNEMLKAVLGGPV